MYQYFCLVLLLRSFSDDKNLETLGRTACLLCPRELPSRNLLVTITQDKKRPILQSLSIGLTVVVGEVLSLKAYKENIVLQD